MDVVDLILEKRQKILSTCAKHGASNVRIFGSCARDDYTDLSDIDILVDFKGDYDLGTICALQDDLELLLKRKVDIATDSMLKPRVRKAILAEAVKI